MKPPITGPRTDPVNAALVKTRKVKTRPIEFQRSEIEPPAQVSGVEPKKPAGKRKVSWAPMLGAGPEVMMKTI